MSPHRGSSPDHNRTPWYIAAVAIFGMAFQQANAIPSIRDQWTFFCGAEKVTKKSVADLREKSDEATGAFGEGVAILAYACEQRRLETQIFKAQQATFEKSPGKGKPPVENHAVSDGLIKRAAESLASDYKSKKRNAKILYHYGLALALANNPLTVNIFDELVTKQAKSEFAGRASLTLGDFYLDRQDVPKAIREYDAAIKSSNVDAKTYAQYKKAWVEFAVAYNQKDQNKQRQAVSKFASLEQSLRDKPGRGDQLSGIIRSDLLELLAVMGNVAEARRILRRVNSVDVLVELLEKMGNAKIDQGDTAGAYNLFAQVLKERPTGAGNVAIQTKMVYLAAQLKNVPNIMSNLRYMAQNYGNEKSAWAKKQEEDFLPIAAQNVENLLFELATTLDREGSQQPPNPQYLAAALELYQLFMKTFPHSGRAYDVQFSLAQLLGQLNKFQVAATMMRKLILKQPRGKLTKDALDIMIVASQKAFEADKTQYTLPEPGMAKRPIKLPEARQLFADCLDLYVKFRPKEPDVPAMFNQAAELYFDFGHYSQANDRYLRFIKLVPTKPEAVTAALRVLFTAKTYLGQDAFAKARQEIGNFPNLKSNKDVAPFYQPQQAPPARGKSAPSDIETVGAKGGTGEAFGDEGDSSEEGE